MFQLKEYQKILKYHLEQFIYLLKDKYTFILIIVDIGIITIYFSKLLLKLISIFFRYKVNLEIDFILIKRKIKGI